MPKPCKGTSDGGDRTVGGGNHETRPTDKPDEPSRTDASNEEKELAKALNVIFLDLSRDKEEAEAEEPCVQQVQWKLEQDGWTLVKAVPDTGA